MRQALEPGRFFLPGPTEVHPDVLSAQAQAMIGHRGKGIQELMEAIGRGLQPVFQTSRPVVISTSSATGLMEAAIRNGVAQGPVLSLVNGAFSGRFAEIATTSGREVEAWEVPWGAVHDPDELDDRLAKGHYEAVTLSQSETSTGALQDLQAIASVVAAHDDTFLLVDSVTGIGGVETHPDDWGVDFILTGSQKALALPPGLAFALASDAMLDKARTIPDRGWYFDLVRLVDDLHSHQTPATPAISLLYALEAQLERVAAEGMEARWKRHLAMQERTFEWVAEMSEAGLRVEPVADEGGRSPTVSCLRLPAAREVVAAMRDAGWVIGSGYGKLKEDTIRIGHMGDHTVEELDELLDTLGQTLR